MTDVIAEIAESGFRTKNPMSGIDQVDDEDTEAAVVPDFFAFAREVFTTGEPHWQVSRAVRVGQGCGILSFTISVLNSLHILSAVQASGVTGVTHPCITGLLTPASSPCSPLHQRAASARASRCSAVPGLPSVTRILQPRVTRILQSRVTRILQSTRVRS
jgi:hypothetical protein